MSGSQHAHSHTTTVSGRKLLWTILFNTLIAVAEIIGGLISGYLALLADAVHNLSDVAALGLAWLGFKGSQLPATKRSTYGYKRVEVMTAFLSAVALIVIAIFILVEAYDRYNNPQPLKAPGLFLAVAVIGFAGNIISIWLLHTEKGKSLNMKAAFLHMFYDAASSAMVIMGGIVILVTGWYVVDVLLSSVIAVMIFWSSYLVIKEAVWIFLEATPEGIEFDAVHEAIAGLPKVVSVHDLHVWSLSSRDIALSCHVEVAESDLSVGPDVVARINNVLHNKFHIGHATIQLESFACERNHVLCQYNDHNQEIL